jgi:hypothetical protein
VLLRSIIKVHDAANACLVLKGATTDSTAAADCYGSTA